MSRTGRGGHDLKREDQCGVGNKRPLTASTPSQNLEPGTYRVSVAAKGFKTGTNRDITSRSDIYSLLSLAAGIQTGQQNPVIPGATWFGSTNMTIDGVSNIDVGNERLGPTVPSLESMAEFKVITNAASAS
jgi:hypothetical protein